MLKALKCKFSSVKIKHSQHWWQAKIKNGKGKKTKERYTCNSAWDTVGFNKYLLTKRKERRKKKGRRRRNGRKGGEGVERERGERGEETGERGEERGEGERGEGRGKEQYRNNKWWCVRDVGVHRPKVRTSCLTSELLQGLCLHHLIRSSSSCLWHVTVSVHTGSCMLTPGRVTTQHWHFYQADCGHVALISLLVT